MICIMLTACKELQFSMTYSYTFVRMRTPSRLVANEPQDICANLRQSSLIIANLSVRRNRHVFDFINCL